MEERRPLYNNDPLFNLTATERGLTFDELLREKAERILANREAAQKKKAREELVIMGIICLQTSR
jgi:hypothetical protein